MSVLCNANALHIPLADESVQLYLGDCLEILPTLVAGSADAVVTDPPYGNGTNYNGYKDTKEQLIKLVRTFMPEVLRITKRVLVTSGVANMWIYPEPTWTLSWVNPGGIGSSQWGFSCWQPILAYGKDPYLQDGLGRRPDTLFQRKNEVDDNNHPCPKPTNVMRWIIERTTRQGDIVLDPFMGSGTTGVACVQTGRNFIGIEINPRYFKIAKERINKAIALQPSISLFETPKPKIHQSNLFTKENK